MLAVIQIEHLFPVIGFDGIYIRVLEKMSILGFFVWSHKDTIAGPILMVSKGYYS